MVVIAGLLVAVVLVAVPVIALNYVVGGGSGPSAAYQAGYNDGLDFGKSPGGSVIDSSMWCGQSAGNHTGVGTNFTDEGARQDWLNGCMAGFQKGSPAPTHTVYPNGHP
jgi:hypothetical protein